LEIYRNTARYVTITGKALNGTTCLTSQGLRP